MANENITPTKTKITITTTKTIITIGKTNVTKHNIVMATQILAKSSHKTTHQA